MKYIAVNRLSETNKTAGSPESIYLLAGGIAYDINNILAAILGNIEMLQIDAEKEDKLMSRLDEAEQAVVQAKDLTQQLLDLSNSSSPTRKQAANKEK